jgi:hypothetical protein
VLVAAGDFFSRSFIVGIRLGPVRRGPFHKGLGFHSHPLAETCTAISSSVMEEALAELARRAARSARTSSGLRIMLPAVMVLWSRVKSEVGDKFCGNTQQPYGRAPSNYYPRAGSEDQKRRGHISWLHSALVRAERIRLPRLIGELRLEAVPGRRGSGPDRGGRRRTRGCALLHPKACGR